MFRPTGVHHNEKRRENTRYRTPVPLECDSPWLDVLLAPNGTEHELPYVNETTKLGEMYGTRVMLHIKKV